MKAGIFSIGLDTYWDQFDGLLDNLLGYHGQIRDRIAGMGMEMVDAGLVDNPEKAGGAARHCAIGVGQVGDKIEKVDALMGIE